MTQIHLPMKQQQNQGHREQTGGYQGKGVREGRSESLRLADGNRYIENG